MATPSELTDAATEAGVNPSAVLEWANNPEVRKDPKYQSMPAAEMVKTFQQTGALLQQATSGKIDLNALTKTLPGVTVTGKRPNIPSTVNPYAGTSQEKAAGEGGNPNASSINQFDPAALQAAQAKYDQYYKDQSLGRGVTGFLAGFGGGTAGVTADRQGWAEKNKEIYDQTVGAQKRLQEQATAGQSAVTSAQQREESAGKFEGTQREQQQKLDIGNFTVEQQRRLNSSSSPETLSLKAIIPGILAKSDIPPEARAELEKISRNPGSTAAQLAPIIATLAPASMKAWQDNITGRKSEQELRTKTATADIDETVSKALTGKGPASTPTGTAPNADVSNGDNSVEAQRRRIANDLAAIDREIAGIPKNDAGRLDILNREKLKIQSRALALGAPQGQPQNEIEKRLPFSSISGAGQTLSPDPRVVAGANAEANASADAEKRFRAYDTTVAPQMQELKKKLASTNTGMGTETIARVWGGDHRDLVTTLNNFNTLYPGVLQGSLGPEMAKAIDKGGFNGVAPSLTTRQVRDMLALIEQTQANDRDYQQQVNKKASEGAAPGQYGANKPMPSTTPKNNAGKPVISNRAEYNKLHPGDEYVDSRDGLTKTKKK